MSTSSAVRRPRTPPDGPGTTDVPEVEPDAEDQPSKTATRRTHALLPEPVPGPDEVPDDPPSVKSAPRRTT